MPAHKNIVRLFKAIEQRGKLYLMMELCSEGDLENYLKNKGVNGKLSENDARYIVRDILRGLVFMSEKCRVMHWDIKLENILVKRIEGKTGNSVRDFEFKIADMGLAKGHAGDNILY
jgi:serine/threonine protein kinase